MNNAYCIGVSEPAGLIRVLVTALLLPWRIHSRPPTTHFLQHKHSYIPQPLTYGQPYPYSPAVYPL